MANDGSVMSIPAHELHKAEPVDCLSLSALHYALFSPNPIEYSGCYIPLEELEEQHL